MRAGHVGLLLQCCVAVSWIWRTEAEDLRKNPLGGEKDLLALPPKFLLGVASSAYQVEGAWNVSGKGESVWDYFAHTEPGRISDGTSGDVACDSYYQYKRDVEMIRELGLNTYRFSLSWPRILPDGTLGNVNKEGIDYYNALIDELLKNGIVPVVTLFHWDLPWRLQQLGGWTNPVVIDYFEDFARLAIASFGDRVKIWITVNEPFQVCEFGYSNERMAPFYNQTGVAGYLCTHNMILGHARVYRMYKEKFAVQGGKMGITIHSFWFEPKDPSNKEDVDAAERSMEFHFGWSANLVFGKHGDYPPVVRRRVDLNSIKEGLTRSRLPTYTPEEIKMMKGSADFLGLNHYFSEYATELPADAVTAKPSRERDLGTFTWPDDNWEGDTLFKNTPWGFRKLLNWIKDHYGNTPVFVTENGIAEVRPNFNDDLRVRYHNGYMREMLKAIYEDGCNIFGYLVWSLMDNYEWTMGYEWRFGLYHVDFNDPKRPRTPKQSAKWFRNVTHQWRIPD